MTSTTPLKSFQNKCFARANTCAMSTSATIAVPHASKAASRASRSLTSTQSKRAPAPESAEAVAEPMPPPQQYDALTVEPRHTQVIDAFGHQCNLSRSTCASESVLLNGLDAGKLTAVNYQLSVCCWSVRGHLVL
jgi:hypothetical protein